MYHSQLVETLESLNLKEMRLFQKFICSPIHNSRRDVIDLFNYLWSKLEDGKATKLSKEKAFTRVYPGEKYSEKKIRYTMSFLFKALKSFLSYQEMTNDPINEQIHLSRALKKRGLYRIYQQEIQKCDKNLKQQPLRNIDFHHKNYQLAYEQFDFFSTQRRKASEDIPIPGDELTIYYIANILRFACSTLSLQRVASSDHRQDLLEEVIDLVEQKHYLNIPAVAIYYYTYKTLTHPENSQYFQSLRQLIRQFPFLLPIVELKNIYHFATNHCIQQVNLGNADYLKELLNLYKDGLAANVFIENKVMGRFTYKNIVMAGLKQREFDWVEQFIYGYKAYLDERYREATFIFNLAILHYHQPDYDKAMDLLRGISFDDVLTDLAARSTLLKIYFEREEMDALNSLLDSFKNFIYRHKELGYHKTNYLNLIRFTKKLLNLKTYDRAALQRLQQEIEQTAALVDKKWLLQQIKIIGKGI
ncbi:MAG: hypothetical protein AAF985_12265 [Bacteroidota bacterium]